MVDNAKQFLMIENSRVIPEAQSILQQSLMMSAIPKPERPSTPSIKDLSRDVDKLISRLPSQFTPLPSIDHESIAVSSPIQPEPAGLTFRPNISKYNYTGKLYRFQMAEKELQVPKAQLSSTKTEQAAREAKEQTRSIYKSRDSVMAEDSFDRSEVKFPSHSYYIVFDKKNKKERESNRQKMNKTAYLQKKVRRLEEEVRDIKYTSAFTATSFKKDGRIKLDKLLDSIIG